MGHKDGLAFGLSLSGQIALYQGDGVTARSRLEESLALYREMGHRAGMVESLALLARVAAGQGDDTAAYTLFEESLALAGEVSHKGLLASCLEGMVSLMAAQEPDEAEVSTGDTPWAARLWGAAEALREAESSTQV